MKNNNSIFKVLIWTILCLSIMYLVIAVANLLPFGINFFLGKYHVYDSLLPNYASTFNSIFTVISIVISSCFSWMVYKINNEQKNNNYNINIASPATAIYYIIKLYVITEICELIKDNKEMIVRSKCKITSGQIKNIDEIILNKYPKVNTERIQEYLFKMIGELKNPNTRHNLFTIVEGIRQNNKLLYFLKNTLIDVKTKELLETREERLIEKYNNIFDDKWDIFEGEHRVLIDELIDIGKNRK